MQLFVVITDFDTIKECLRVCQSCVFLLDTLAQVSYNLICHSCHIFIELDFDISLHLDFFLDPSLLIQLLLVVPIWNNPIQIQYTRVVSVQLVARHHVLV